MQDYNVKKIVRTALLVALAIVFQYVGRFIPLGPNSNFIVGPLVNACLLIATFTVGLWSGVFVAIVTPLVALLQGAVAVPVLTPIIAIANISIVVVYYIFMKKNQILGIILGSIVKFIIMFASTKIVLNLITELPAPKMKIVTYVFSWPQLVTALAGGAIALAVIKLLPKSISE